MQTSRLQRLRTGGGMPEKMFFARLAPEFALHEESARETAGKHDDVKRLITSAEYACYQVRRELGLNTMQADTGLRNAHAAPQRDTREGGEASAPAEAA